MLQNIRANCNLRINIHKQTPYILKGNAMNKEYSAGKGNTITLQVSVGTEGAAQSKVVQRKPAASPVKLLSSPLSDANIPATTIGSSETLTGSTVCVYTIIDLSAIPAQNIPAAIDKMSIRYTFSGGPNGAQSFQPDSDDIEKTSDSKTITIIKQVEINS